MPLENWIPHSRVDEFLYDWQTIIAGVLALAAALIAVCGSEWRTRKALRASLASEIRLYLDLLIQMLETLKASESWFEPPRVCRRLFRLSHAAMAGCSIMA
jgi:hypothetical protein